MRSAGSDGARESSDKPGLAALFLARFHAAARSGLARLGTSRGERHMALVEKLELGGRRQLLLVVCDGQRYLVGAGNDSIHSIAAMRAEPEVNHPADEAIRCNG